MVGFAGGGVGVGAGLPVGVERPAGRRNRRSKRGGPPRMPCE